MSVEKTFTYEEIFDILSQIEREIREQSYEISTQYWHTPPGAVERVASMVADRAKGTFWNVMNVR